MALDTDQIEVCNQALRLVGSQEISSSETSQLKTLCENAYDTSVETVIRRYKWNCTKAYTQLQGSKTLNGDYKYALPSDCVTVETTENPAPYYVRGGYIYTDFSFPVGWIDKDVSYSVGDYVDFDGYAYECDTAHVSYYDTSVSAYSGDESYSAGDYVSQDDTIFMATQDVSGTSPSDDGVDYDNKEGTYWQYIGHNLEPDESDKWTLKHDTPILGLWYVASGLGESEWDSTLRECITLQIAVDIATKITDDQAKRRELREALEMAFSEARRVNAIEERPDSRYISRTINSRRYRGGISPYGYTR